MFAPAFLGGLVSGLLAAGSLGPAAAEAPARPASETPAGAKVPAVAPVEPAPVELEASAPAPSGSGSTPAAEASTNAPSMPGVGGVPAGTYRVQPPEKDGPPYYTVDDLHRFRARHGLPPQLEAPRRRSRWGCLIADQTCGMTFEIQASSAYARRFRQGDVSDPGDVAVWNSARVQYDAQLNVPAFAEVRGLSKYTRLTLGPKGGIIASDSRELWGNAGVAARYFFTLGRFSPTLEWSTALTFQLTAACRFPDEGREQTCIEARRSPAGVHGDVGVGLGGWGSIVLGGQYNSPLAREDLPEALRVPASGMFYVGWRGNILWGAPALSAVGTHAVATRIEAP